MDVGTIGYLIILHFNDDPSLLKQSVAFTVYCVTGGRNISHPQSIYRSKPHVT